MQTTRIQPTTALARAAQARREQHARGALRSVEGVRPATTEVRTAAAARQRARFRRFRPTAIQDRMLRCTAPRRLLRGPNQIGKTEGMCADVVDLMLGEGRWQPDRARRHPPPVECWVVCSSWRQSLVIQRKLYAMLGDEALAKGTKFTQKRGFTGQSFQTANGSLCTIVTINQDTDQLASATLDAVFVDEVPTEDAWGELVARVRHKSGQIALYFTPINRPVEWLRRKVESGEIVEFHTALDLAAVTPLGALRPFQTQEQLDQFARDVPPWRRAQQVYGEWEGATEGRWVADYDPERHDRDDWPEGADWLLAVGLDYGLRPGKMAAALVAVRAGYTTHPEVCFLDEAAAGEDETWTMEELVGQVLRMLGRNGLSYDHVDEWTGDRSAVGKGGKVSNRHFRAHMAAALGRSESQVKSIAVPRKGANSVEHGCGLINAVFARDAAWVWKRCMRFRQFLAHFDGNARDKAKDAGDAGRYAFLKLVNPAAWYKVRAA